MLKKPLILIAFLLFSKLSFAAYDTDDIKPLKALIEIKAPPQILPLILLVLLILIATGVFIYIRKRKTEEVERVFPPRPPEEAATEELERLLAEGLIDKGLVKEYYIRLSDIIRNYIGSKYNIFCLDRTTWEISQEMKERKIDRKHVVMIKVFLEECDLVKFAKYIPGRKEIDASFIKAKEIVESNSMVKAQPLTFG